LSIWSLRRGDNDDNRMSPHGLGLRSILLSAFLEFNLKAPISFLTLVLGPALLVGIAPSVVITYGRLLFYTSASLGYRPTITLALLAALVGLALWIGRPLLVMSIDNFWHLHYTLVFPIFVVYENSCERLWNGSAIHPRLPYSLIADDASALSLQGFCLRARAWPWLFLWTSVLACR
jgi:hypothetical protein